MVIVDHVGRDTRTNRIAVMNPMGTRSLCSLPRHSSFVIELVSAIFICQKSAGAGGGSCW